MAPKILLDLRSMDYGHSGGIENYTYYFIDSLKYYDYELILDVRASSRKIYEKKYADYPNIKIICDPIEGIYHHLKHIKLLGRILSKSDRILNRLFGLELFRRRKKWANSINADLVYYSNHCDELQHNNIPEICTIHAILPGYSDKVMSIIERHIENSSALITSWHYPYKEFIEKYPNKKNDWYMLPYIAQQNIDNKRQTAVKEISGKYFLYVSFFLARKNHKNLVLAYDLALKIRKELPILVFVGNGEINCKNEIKELIATLNLNNKIKIFDYLPDEKVSYLYHHAEAIISPTLWEAASGTVIEATYCSKPVLCSDVPPLLDFAEYFGLKMLFFDPLDINDMKDKIILLYDGLDSYNKWSSENSDKMKKYDSKYFGEGIDKIIKKVLDNDTENKYVA